MTSDLHQVIDAVAARMTETQPSAAFHANVMANLRRAPRVPWPAFALACAGLAAVCAVSMWMLRERYAPPAAPAHASSPQRGGTPALVQLETARDSGATIVKTQIARTLSPEERAWLARSVPPLAAVSMLVIEPIQPSPSSIAPITVESLVTEPIELAPLESRSGGR
jgi:hypothetical protein